MEFDKKISPNNQNICLAAVLTKDVNIVPLSQVSFEDLISYDTEVNLIRREEWIKPLTELADSVAAINNSHQIVGYVGIDQNNDEKFTQIKPLLADNPKVAATLLNHALKIVPSGYRVKVKIPSENAEAVSLMEKVGFSTKSSKAPDMIMFTKRKFQVKINKVYSVLNGWNQFA